MSLLLTLVACMPRYHALPAITPDELYSPLSVQHVEVDGVDVAYVDSGGEGPPLVFVHGLSSYLGFWEHQLPAFAETHRVLALDLPGYGASGRPDAPYTPPWYAAVVSGWLDALDVDSATVVGHSMGGQVALTLALDEPSRVDVLVLSAPAGFERFRPGHAAWMKDYWHEERALHTSEVEIRRAFTTAVFNRVDAGVERLIEERVRMATGPRFAGTSVAVSRSIAGMLDHPVHHRLSELRVPTLIVFGTDDRMIPNPVFTGGRARAIAEAGHGAIAGSQLVMIGGAGHTVHHDAPAEFNRAVAAFLAEHAPVPVAPPPPPRVELEVSPPGTDTDASATPWGAMTALLWLAALASATPSFDPGAPEARYTGPETWTHDGELKLWSALELHADPDRTLFDHEEFNDVTAWVDADYAPFIATAFGSSTPHSSSFLLHMGPNEEVASGTPVLMLPGAGDNGSRSFVTMATKLDQLLRPAYALTFAHPHGDVFLQAEVVADAIAVIKARTGAEQVDVVAHSKGGLAAAVYAAHTGDASWGHAAYEEVGTPYRGDIRRLVLIAVPMGGVDTLFRWTALNLMALDADTALQPTSWQRYFPLGTTAYLHFEELYAQDLFPDRGDLFPGQRQLLRRQDHPLPGTLVWLGGYALQPDWYTTYEGGLGLWSDSEGIDAAIDAGGRLLGRLAAQGLDPSVEVFQLAGSNPVLPNSSEVLGGAFGAVGDAGQWQVLVDAIDSHGIPLEVAAEELAGLADGDLILGEVTGPSDGLVFVDSALHSAAITARGGEVVEQRVADLSHLDLLYASPITGELLIEVAAEEPDAEWMAAFGRRYVEADTLGWVVSVLADPPGATSTDDTGVDATSGDREKASGGDAPRPCGGCATSRLPATAALWVLLAVVAARRR